MKIKQIEEYVFGWIVLWFIIFTSCKGQTTSITPDVCDVWKNSADADYSYVVKIQVQNQNQNQTQPVTQQQKIQFCPGVLVEKYWVLMSYKCFQEISSDIPQEFRKQFQNTQCFDIKNLQDAQMEIRTVTDNCIIGVEDQKYARFTIPQFGVIFDNFSTIYIDVLNELKNNPSSPKNGLKFPVYVGDFLLLKLRDLFDGVPVDHVKLSTFDNTRKNISYEMFLQVQDQMSQVFQFGQMSVKSEQENWNFTCSPNFQESVCAQNKQICTKQNYICGEFTIPYIPQLYFYFPAGNPIVKKQDSMYAEIFGFLTTDYMTKKDVGDLYTLLPGNYSFDLNGAIFIGWKQEHLDWVQKTTKNYIKNYCMEISLIEEDNNFTIILVSVMCSLIFLVVVALAICLFWRKIKDQEKNLHLGDRRPDLNLSEMMSLEEAFLDNHQDVQDTAFNDPPEWWSLIKIPQGVREIPISDLKYIKRLGAGGFAVVYQAGFEDHAMEKYSDLGVQQVAVKIVFKEYLQIKDSMDAILKEIGAISKLASEHIVKLLGASLSIKPSIVMELVPQGSLEDLLEMDGYKCNQTSLTWKLKLMLNITKGIQYLHSQNVFHRDLKPPNILIQDRDAATTKISDFGLAKIQQTTQVNCSSNHVAGTRQYMAPEMFEKSVIDEKVDIWALGVIMQQILRGIKPWQGQNEHYIVARVLVHKEPPDNGDLPQNCPEDLSQLITSCWKQRDQRPSADWMVQKLETVLKRESNFTNISLNSSHTVLPFEIQKDN